MKHILPTELVNRILNYLATRAYSDVSVLIRDIQSMSKPHEDPKPDTSAAVPPALPELKTEDPK